MTTCACTARSRIETGKRETQGKKHRGKSTEHKKRTKQGEKRTSQHKSIWGNIAHGPIRRQPCNRGAVFFFNGYLYIYYYLLLFIILFIIIYLYFILVFRLYVNYAL